MHIIYTLSVKYGCVFSIVVYNPYKLVKPRTFSIVDCFKKIIIALSKASNNK